MPLLLDQLFQQRSHNNVSHGIGIRILREKTVSHYWAIHAKELKW